jgi:intein/homing endonuclease
LCLAGDTQVQTQDGIKSLQDVKVGDKVYSRNTDTGEDEYKLVTDSALMNNESEVYEIEDDNGNTIRCTADHKIWTENRGYVLAKELEETDILKSI